MQPSHWVKHRPTRLYVESPHCTFPPTPPTFSDAFLLFLSFLLYITHSTLPSLIQEQTINKMSTVTKVHARQVSGRSVSRVSWWRECSEKGAFNLLGQLLMNTRFSTLEISLFSSSAESRTLFTCETRCSRNHEVDETK